MQDEDWGYGVAQYVDLGDLCVHCRKSTSFGSGRFVNRYPVSELDVNCNGVYYTGYCCYACEEEWEAEHQDYV
jgi:hypothetical protein